jgi:hypothetical protein
MLDVKKKQETMKLNRSNSAKADATKTSSTKRSTKKNTSGSSAVRTETGVHTTPDSKILSILNGIEENQNRQDEC